jgi:phosphohistidine swiveling domain-containing protein
MATKKSDKLTLAALPELPDEFESAEEAAEALVKMVKWSLRTSSQLEELGTELADQSTTNLALVNDGVKEAAASLDKAILEVEKLKASLYTSLDHVRKALGKKLGLTAAPARAGKASGAPRTNGARGSTDVVRAQVLATLAKGGSLNRAAIEQALNDAGTTYSRSTLQQTILPGLREDGYLSTEGKKRGMSYSITAAGRKQLA